MARICVNALSVNPAMTGIGQYAKSLLDALAGAKAHGDHGFTILGSAGHDMLRNGYPREWRLEVVKGAGPLWEQTALPTPAALRPFGGPNTHRLRESFP
ncbi:MAG: hypothetical protein ACYTFI_09010 [Planctomycetota bacterium]|jgi:hypothetical protein